LREREARGSTFLNEGIGLPHARVEGLNGPQIAIGVTHDGVLDSPVATPIEIVVLLLTPSGSASTHLQLLAAIGRLWQDRDLRKAIKHAKVPTDVVAAIRFAIAPMK
jgi:mannitol/fructose-specific phosphotransferase system IIA component (Ntr-type)